MIEITEDGRLVIFGEPRVLDELGIRKIDSLLEDGTKTYIAFYLGISYTKRYGKTYQEWAEEKAKRILEVLRMCYLKGIPLDVQYLMKRLYWERLFYEPKWKWKPISGRFTDFKPSPFMKNFVRYLLEKLLSEGYLYIKWEVSAQDRVRALDTSRSLEVERVRIVRKWVHRREVEIREKVRALEPRLEILRTPLKILDFTPTLHPRRVIVEAREVLYVKEPEKPLMVETGKLPPTITYYIVVKKLPSLDYLVDLCTWKN